MPKRFLPGSLIVLPLSLAVFAVCLTGLSARAQDKASQKPAASDAAEKFYLGIPGLRLAKDAELVPTVITTCEVYYLCDSGGGPEPVGQPLVGEWEGESEACQACALNLECDADDCDEYEGGGERICCDLENPEPGSECANWDLEPICTYSQNYIKKTLEYRSKRLKAPYRFEVYSIAPPAKGSTTFAFPFLYEYIGVGKLDQRPFSFASSSHALARNVFFKKAEMETRDGIVEGSLQLRTVPFMLYKAYVRVKSEKGDVLYDQQVEARAHTREEAVTNAVVAAHRLAELLLDLDHEDVDVVGGHRLVVDVNTLSNSCPGSYLCRHECATMQDGKTVIAARYRGTYEDACVAAEASAIMMADNYGGVMPGSCRNLGELANAKSTITTAGCADCGN